MGVFIIVLICWGKEDAELQWIVSGSAAAIAAILNLMWRRQLLRFLAFLAGYIALISKYGTLHVIHPLLQSLKLLSALRPPPSSPKSLTSSDHVTSVTSAIPPLLPSPPVENKHDDRVHCQVLHDPGEVERTVDVIFIHGLHGSLRNTWRQGDWGHAPARRVLRTSRSDADLEKLTSPAGVLDNNNSEPYAQCWPRDWLPRDCPGARVIALNYTTDPYLWRPVWVTKRNRSCLVTRSREMAKLLQDQGVGSRPIVWVAHSKGGLFVKQMLVEDWELKGSQSGFCTWTRGIQFYSVPHRGSALALIDPPLLRQSIELMEVKKDSPQVLDLHDRFLRLCEQEHFRPQLVSFFETKLTLMSVLFLRIVTPESADPDEGELYGVHLDHRQICKPRSRNCFLYRSLIDLIERVL